MKQDESISKKGEERIFSLIQQEKYERLHNNTWKQIEICEQIVIFF